MERIDFLIKKYWSGTATSSEILELTTILRLEEDSLRDFLLTKYQDDTLYLKEIVSDERSHQIKQKILESIQLCDKDSIQESKRKDFNWIWSAAAMLGGLIIGIAIWAYYGGKEASTPTTNLVVSKKVQKEDTTLINHSNSIMNVSLQDGSHILMQPGSKVTYANPFDAKSREISLDGEAQFNVAKNAKWPFNVTARGIVTTAIGTKFIVNTNKNNYVSIALLEGKVLVHSAMGQIKNIKNTFLYPGQKLNADLLNGNLSIEEEKKSPKSNLRQNVSVGSISENLDRSAPLSFKNTPLEKVFKQLSEYYKINITFDPQKMNGLTFTGTILPTYSQHSVLTTICSLNDLNFNETEQGIDISR